MNQRMSGKERKADLLLLLRAETLGRTGHLSLHGRENGGSGGSV